MLTKLTRLMLIPIFSTISWTFAFRMTEYSDLVKDSNMQHFPLKKFKYDDYITKQSFDLSSELHINKYKILFILNSVPEILEQYRNLAQANCIPIPDPIAITSSVQSALFFHYYTDYNSEGVKIRFGIRLPNIYIQNFCSKNGILSEIDLKFNEVEQIYQSLTFLVNYVTSFPMSYPYLVNK